MPAIFKKLQFEPRIAKKCFGHYLQKTQVSKLPKQGKCICCFLIMADITFTIYKKTNFDFCACSYGDLENDIPFHA